MKTSHRGLAAGIAVGAAAAVFIAQYYRKQKWAAVEHLRSGSRLAQTSCGLIEFAEVGQGPAVLISHGSGGSYRHALNFAWPNTCLRFIGVSRPGYSRTPLDTGRAFEEQADAFAALLDSLGIEKAAIVGMSAGGPAAIQFAARHPDRCWGLALVSAINQPTPALPPSLQFFERALRASDFLPWLMLNTPLVYLLSGRKLLEQLGSDRTKWDLFRQTIQGIFPISLSRDGILNDLEQARRMTRYPMDEISAPTLVIHGDADKIAPFEQGQWSAGRIPGAMFLVVENGGHLSFISHLDQTRQALISFLQVRAPE